MRRATKSTSIVAAAAASALGIGLVGFGTGVGADFISAVTGTANASVGNFGCQLSAPAGSQVQIGNNGSTATITFSPIESSAPGLEDVTINVKNVGSEPVEVNSTVTQHGNLFATGNISALALSQGDVVQANEAANYKIGFQWPNGLTSGDLKTSGYATYAFTCTEPGATTRPADLQLFNQDGATASWNGGDIVTTIPSGVPADAGAFIKVTDASQSLPNQAPTITATNAALGTPRWYIKLATTPTPTYLFGWVGSTTGHVDYWILNTGGPQLTWDQVLATYGSDTVASVGVVVDTSHNAVSNGITTNSVTNTISCLSYGSAGFGGTCQ